MNQEYRDLRSEEFSGRSNIRSDAECSNKDQVLNLFAALNDQISPKSMTSNSNNNNQ